MDVKEYVNALGFALIAIGTVGLLVTEFALESGCTASALTKVFAASNGVGFAALAYAHWRMRQKYPTDG